jgi:hypothetical protein
LKTVNPSPKFLQSAAAAALAIVIAWGLSIPSAQADPYVVTLEQVGSNVVASGTGAFDLSGLTFNAVGGSQGQCTPGFGAIIIGPAVFESADDYRGFSGPTSFGPNVPIGVGTLATNGTGDLVGIVGNSDFLFVPRNYVSNTTLLSSSTWDNATLASLGATPGVYVWTWGTGPDQKFTLQIGPVTVPDSGSTFVLLLVALSGQFAVSRFRSFRSA